ncbi:MAG: DUF371 domain-containing protein [Candidatus Kariarchaeaceae archaeon]
MSNEFVIRAYGHKNITALHKTTWQLTKENDMTPSGHCIIGVNSSAATSDLPPWLKEHLKIGGQISIRLFAGGKEFEGTAQGSPSLTLDDKTDIVFRKSDFKSPRTIAINCSFTACDLPRSIVKKLKDPDEKLQVTIKKE